LKHAPKLFKEDCKIDWAKSADSIFNFVRGLSPYPAAWTELNGKSYKIYALEISEKSIQGAAGSVQSNENGEILVQTGEGTINILELQLQGKKRMLAKDFLRGNKI
jgi:methionyl-tRNA formyltransferase